MTNTPNKNSNETRSRAEAQLKIDEQLPIGTNSRRANVYDQVTARVISLLEAGTVPWRLPWEIQFGLPRNLITKKPYRGINVFLLRAMGYESAFWLTFRQAVELGGNVRKGEKACPVVFWKQRTVEDEENGKEKEIPFLRFYHVFNIDQCEGLKNISTIQAVPVMLPTKPAAIIENMPQRPAIKHGMSRAFYSPSGDFVGLPFPQRFNQEAAYYSTLFHELTHATGHESRLNRPAVTDSAVFASHSYCKEELVAEMGAAFLCGHAGIAQHTIENSAAYLQSWLKQLRGDKKLIVQAAAQAQKAADFILGAKFPQAQAPEEGGNNRE
jgi:antirestriction protein ArdC